MSLVDKVTPYVLYSEIKKKASLPYVTVFAGSRMIFGTLVGTLIGAVAGDALAGATAGGIAGGAVATGEVIYNLFKDTYYVMKYG